MERGFKIIKGCTFLCSNMDRSLIFIIGLCLSLLLVPVFSLEAKDIDNTVTMDEVVVTATKTEEKRKDIPNSVVTIGKFDIEESSATTVGDLVANELGVDLRTYGNYGGAAQEIHLRGMSGDATQVLVNGVNVNSSSLGVADVAKIPLNNIERIEIVKGSGSLLYGSGAMGGTVNIITKSPSRDKGDLRISAGYGTEETYNISAEQGMFFTDNLGYYLTASHRETDGFRDNSDLKHNDVSLKLVYDGGDILDVSLYGDYIDREYGRPGVLTPSGTQDYYIGGVKFYSGESASVLDRGGDEDGHIVLQVKSDPYKWLGLSLKGDYTYMENYNYARYHSDGTGLKSWVTNEITGVEGNVELRPFEGSTLLIGADYKDYSWKNEGVSLDISGNDLAGSETKTKAALNTKGTYAEAQYRPCQYFKAIAGIRHEEHSTFGNENLSRFGLVINPLSDTVLKISHGKHFKAPTPNDLFWPYENWGWGMGTQGNPNLNPETGWHTDATVEQSLFDGKVFLTASYFKWDIKDKIRWVPDSSFFYRPENLDSYEAQGLELGTKIGPFYDTSLSLSYTYTDAKENKQGGVERQALYTPDNQFKGTLTYWTQFDLTAAFTVRYVGKRPALYSSDTSVDASRTLSSYWTTDIKFEQRLYEHWILTLMANNLFDKGYETYVSTFYDYAFNSTLCAYPGGERSVFLSVGYEF